METVLTIVFGIIGGVGAALTVYYGRKSARLERERETLSWNDVQLAADDLAEDIRKSRFQPQFILALNTRGGIIAEFVAQNMADSLPIVVGITEWRDFGYNAYDLKQYDSFETTKWRVSIPLTVYDNTDKNVLIVDDLVMSGDAMEEARKRLAERGFTKDAIRTAAIVVTDVAIKTHKAPDYHWRQTDSSSFYFPWGKAR